MHPILDDRRRLALYLLVWLMIGLLLSVGSPIGRMDDVCGVPVPLCFLYAFVCLSAWYLCRAFPLGGQSSRSAHRRPADGRPRRERALDDCRLSLGRGPDALVAGSGAQPFYAQHSAAAVRRRRPALLARGRLTIC